MTLDDAIGQACATVGILPPQKRAYGRWIKADTQSGRNGKGDGRLIINDHHVTAWNWQTGETATVAMGDDFSPRERRQVSAEIERQKRRKAEQARQAAGMAAKLVAIAVTTTHAYLASKGFPNEKVLVLGAADIAATAGPYLVPEGGKRAIIMPARRGARITSAQVIWEDGTKKFLFGGEVGGGSHRIASGVSTWLCEGLATGLSLREALKGSGRTDTVLCCFSASNVAEVARAIGRCFIAADNVQPLPQFGDVGTGEYYARQSGQPYTMPPAIGADFNDMHQADGIFAVQRRLSTFLREVKV